MLYGERYGQDTERDTYLDECKGEDRYEQEKSDMKEPQALAGATGSAATGATTQSDICQMTFNRPARRRFAPRSVRRRTCTNWKCYKQNLWWMEVGDCRQTNNGFLVVKIKGWYCPKCGGSYGGNPPNAEIRRPGTVAHE